MLKIFFIIVLWSTWLYNNFLYYVLKDIFLFFSLNLEITHTFFFWNCKIKTFFLFYIKNGRTSNMVKLDEEYECLAQICTETPKHGSKSV